MNRRPLFGAGQELERGLGTAILVGFSPLRAPSVSLSLEQPLELVIPRRIPKQIFDRRRRVVGRKRVMPNDAFVGTQLESRSQLQSRDARRIDIDQVQPGDGNWNRELLAPAAIPTGEQ
ncbi:MAG: hypothetical protein Q8T13_20065 [Acidobacteriota bacterium]|nr:hypothetical protein [Acidobacteriota bacterium]